MEQQDFITYHIIHTGSGHINVFLQSPTVFNKQHPHYDLLTKIHNFWIESVLQRVLHGEAVINLDKEVVPGMVDHPWHDIVKDSDSPYAIDLNQSIKTIFEKMGNALLILGEPGAGKSVVLLQLLVETWSLAIEDPNRPIPLYFHLSSWKKGQSLTEWLGLELRKRYNIDDSLIKEEKVLLLLDGLDEVPTDIRNACVIALNEFCTNMSHSNIVVCCRQDEYKSLSTRLKLRGAIRLKPLTLTKIDHYITEVVPTENLKRLKEALEKYESLRKLAKTPLMLHIMIKICEDGPIELTQQTKDENSLRTYLFEVYTHQMFDRAIRTNIAIYPKSKTIYWLSWLAQKMNKHNQSQFMLEEMQPSLLSTPRQQWGYVLISRITLGILLSYFFLGTAGFFIGIFFGGIIGLITGYHFQYGTENKANNNISSRTNFLLIALLGAIPGIATGIITGVILGIALTILNVTNAFYGLTIAKVAGICVGFIQGIAHGFIFHRRGQNLREDIHRREALDWSSTKAVKGIIIGLGFAILISLLLGIPFSLAVGNATHRIIGIASGLAITSVMLIVYSSLGGLMGGLQGRKIEKITYPGQGIWLNLRNAVIGGILASIVAGTLFTLLDLVLYISMGGFDRNLGLISIVIGFVVALSLGLNTAILVGGFVALWYGGSDLIRHYILRLFLWEFEDAPWNFIRFLDYATERIFLWRVGGNYLFIHRYLQDYFASLNGENGRWAEGNFPEQGN